MIRKYLRAHGDGREVITDDRAGYFGTAVDDQSLTPGENARLGPTRFEGWLGRSVLQPR